MISKGKKRAVLILLLIVNGIMLLGQVWPAGAPPFARGANILFLTLNLLVLFSVGRKS